MKRIVLIVFILISVSVFGQVGISLYPLNNTVGFKTSNLKPISFEMRMGFDISHSTTDFLYILQPSANLVYHIHNEENVNFYSGIGGGCGLNNANGNSISASVLLGVEFYPIITMRNLNFTAELDPDAQFYIGYQTFKMMGLIGFSYYFSKPEKKTKNE